MTDAQVQPRRFRFSLRSLILFVLLCGTGYGLWMRWEPWVVAQVVKDPAKAHLPPQIWNFHRFVHAYFSPDSTKVLAWTQYFFRMNPSGSTAWGPSTGKVYVQLWDTTTGEPVWSTPIQEGAIWFHGFSPDGSRFLTSEPSGRLCLWDAATGRKTDSSYKIPYANNDADCIVQTVDFSPDGKRILVIVLPHSQVHILDSASLEQVLVLTGHELEFFDGTFSPDSQRFITATPGTTESTIRIWDAASGQQLLTIAAKLYSSASFSPDGRSILVSNYQGGIFIYDARTGKEVQRIENHPGYIRSAKLSTDGGRLLTEGWTKNKSITPRLWDAATGKLLLVLHDAKNRLSGVAFSPDESRILKRKQGPKGVLLDAETGEELFVLPGSESTFSPDGTHIATIQKNSVLIYHRRRPEWWWGAAWLPEFWLTVVLGSALGYSMWRDRRAWQTTALN